MSRFERATYVGGGRILLGFLLAAAWLAVMAPGASADQVACGQVVRASTTVTNSLLGCAGDGLVIGAGGITVDLNGHTIEGAGLGVGVRNDGHDDVTVRNGAVKNFDYGIVLNPGTARNTISGINLDRNEWSSVELGNAVDNVVAHNRMSEFSDVGVHLSNGSSRNVLESNTIAGGNGEAFVVDTGSNSNRLQGNVVLSSSDNALRVDSSANTMILGNQLSGGSDVAIVMTAASGSVVQGNTVATGGDAAILLSDATANVVRFNALSRSADAGVIFSSVSNSLVKANEMTMSGDAAIILRAGSNGNRVIDNRADHSSDAGIFIGDGESNVVRGNTLLNNAIGIEVSGGKQNLLEFNAAQASLGTGIEIAGSGHTTVFGNTTDNNLQGGIWVEGSDHSTVSRNAARFNGGDGISVNGAGPVVGGNLATHNQGWGIYASPGVVDGGGNGARGNAEAAQCYLVACSDGSDWRAPIRPPEPLDPLELGLPDLTAVGARRVPAGRPRARRGRLGVVRCKRRRVVRRNDDPVRGRKRARVVCKASYRARRSSRRVSGHLVRGGKSFAHGARRVRAGRRGRLAMTARRRPRKGRYMLVLSFSDTRRHSIVVRRAVRVR